MALPYAPGLDYNYAASVLHKFVDYSNGTYRNKICRGRVNDGPASGKSSLETPLSITFQLPSAGHASLHLSEDASELSVLIYNPIL